MSYDLSRAESEEMDVCMKDQIRKLIFKFERDWIHLVGFLPCCTRKKTFVTSCLVSFPLFPF